MRGGSFCGISGRPRDAARRPAAGTLSLMERDHLIDIARALAVVAVVVYHTLFFTIGLDDGELTVARWVPSRELETVGWLVMLLPLFFIASGWGHAAAQGVRGIARIAGPLLLFVTALATVSTVAAWQPGTAPALPYPGATGRDWLEVASNLSRDYADFLWFLTAYLVVVVVARGMVREHERRGLRVAAALTVVAAAADALAAAVDPAWRNVNWVAVWLVCHQFGIALQRGWLRHGRPWMPWAALVGGAGGLVLLITAVGYPASPIVNYYPPSLALVLLGVAQTGALALLMRAGVARHPGPAAVQRLGVFSAHLLTIYLWQAACIILAVLLLVGAGRMIPALAPLLVSWPAIALVSAAVLAVAVPRIARVERWVTARLQAGPHGVRIATPLLLAGTTLVWRTGAVLHPRQPWSTAGVLLVWSAGALLAADAARRRRVR